jgi:formylmethanofuran dehydrogenase subunit B
MPDPSGPITCAGCGLLCDDVMVERVGDDVRLTPECRLGAEWFAGRAGTNAQAAAIDGAPADVDAALARAAELLRGARRPLLHGFAGATVEDARAAVALADHLGALVATGTVTGVWPGAPAAPLRGASTATLGEIRDRSRLVVIWRENPEATHPRLLSRLGLADGQRTLVVVDDGVTDTARRADLRLRWPAERDLEALVTLHALARGVASRDGDGLAGPLDELLERIGDVPHVTFIYGPGLTDGAGGQRRALALFELVRALASERHVVTLALPPAAGTRGADDVLAWQTGYASAVDLAGGHPELVTATESLLTAEDVDVAVRVEGGPAPGLTGVAEIALGAPLPDVAVSIRTAAAGVEAGGTAHRLDGVPLALQAPAPGDAPTAADLLTRLLAEVAR